MINLTSVWMSIIQLQKWYCSITNLVSTYIPEFRMQLLCCKLPFPVNLQCNYLKERNNLETYNCFCCSKHCFISVIVMDRIDLLVLKIKTVIKFFIQSIFTPFRARYSERPKTHSNHQSYFTMVRLHVFQLQKLHCSFTNLFLTMHK